MATLVLRNVKGSPLTNQECDDNFSNLNVDVLSKLDASLYTAADVLTKIKTLDGPGSGLDADSVDGYSTDTANTVSTIVRRDINGDFYAGTVNATTFIGNVTGTVTGNLIGNVSGNAATATTTAFAATVVTNANLTGMVTSVGNAATVITNANLTGGVTSIGNAATVVTNANLTGDATSIGNATTVVKINGTTLSGLATGILKNTTSTGVPSIAVAGDFPTLNQNTSGSAASSGSVVTTNFSIVQSGGKLYFKYGATNIASLDSAGIFTTLNDVIAYTAP